MDTNDLIHIPKVAAEVGPTEPCIAQGPGTVKRAIATFSIDRRILGEFQRLTRGENRSRVVENIFCAFLRIKNPEHMGLEVG